MDTWSSSKRESCEGYDKQEQRGRYALKDNVFESQREVEDATFDPNARPKGLIAIHAERWVFVPLGTVTKRETG